MQNKLRMRAREITRTAKALRVTHEHIAHKLSSKPKAKFTFEPPAMNGTIAKILYRTEQDLIHELLYPEDFK